MRNLASLLALPASLISVPTVQCQNWPYDLPAGSKYYPEHESHMKRNLEIQQRIASNPPQGIRKMSNDEGEKFFMDYWQFEESTSGPIETAEANGEVQSMNHRRGLTSTTCNVSDHSGLLPPLLLHGDLQQPVYLPRIFGRSLFERGWNCPTGTSNCESIGESDSCCATGETCVALSGSDDASVGCCPSGATCVGDVGSCNTAEGYTSCSAGGCCIPGYTCQGVGCVYASTATTTTTLPAVTVTTGVSWSTLIDSTTTETFVVSAGSQSGSISTTTTTLVMTPSASAGLTTVTQTIILTPASSLSSTTTTASLLTTTSLTTTTSVSTKAQGSLVCSSGFRTCPASLGGGCCPTDRECGSVSCPASSSTATAVPPLLATSGSGSSADASSSTTTSTTSYSGCPTGFYMCSAYYLGGCCRVGRDCDTTSCPTSASTAVVTGTGLTIEAPSGASSAAITGSCATGWLSCAASNGGGCCPTGYSCGESCTASVSGQSNVGKEAPSEAVKARLGGWVLLVLGIVSGVAMVFL